MLDAVLPVKDPRLRVHIRNPQRFRLKTNRRAKAKPRGDQVLDHFLLRINGDGFPGEFLEIDAMPRAIKAQLNPVVLQPLAIHPRAHAGFAQDFHGSLFQHSGAHTAFNVLARVALQDNRFDPLQLQQMRQRQPAGPRR